MSVTIFELDTFYIPLFLTVLDEQLVFTTYSVIIIRNRLIEFVNLYFRFLSLKQIRYFFHSENALATNSNGI